MRIIKSPNLRAGDGYIPVTLSETPRFARGGTVRKNEIQLHLSPQEFKYLQSKWGAPHARGGKFTYNLKSGISQILKKAEGGRVFDPLENDSSYYTYGEGPEHQFVTGNAPKPLITGDLGGSGLPVSDTSHMGGNSTGVGNGLAALGAIRSAGSLASGASALGQSLGYNPQWLQTAGTAGRAINGSPGAIKDLAGSLTGANVAMDPAIGTGALGNQALAEAGFGSGATAAGLAGSQAAIGSGAAANAALAEAGFGGGAGAGAAGAGAAGAGTAAAGTGVMSSLGAVAPLAAAGFATASLLNTALGKDKSHEVSALLDAYGKQGGVQPVSLGRAGLYYALPDGRIVTQNQLLPIVNAWASGDQNAYNAALQGAKPASNYSPNTMNQIYDYLQRHYGDKAFLHHARGGAIEGDSSGLGSLGVPHAEGHVAGPGTGRSDEIDAKLSDGEYVMDAETVAMLGDGSTNAGAKRLDSFRENIRKHKGKKLSRGHISPNAKQPHLYLGK